MHEPKFECEDCQKQCEQQLRNKSVPHTIQQKSDENCCENAANCNKPSSQGNSSNNTANVSAAQQYEGNNNNNNANFVAAPQLNRNFCQKSPENRSQKVIECCDKQNARHSVSQESHQVDYSLSNRPNENQREVLRKFEPDSRTMGAVVNDSGQVTIQRLSDCLEKIEERLAISNAKMEKVVTDMKELGQVVDHDIMRRDQDSARFFQQLLEEV
ncbi:MAG: hypothetical protein GY820_01865 [Gammaproteobacteria bacterium]|nr:hypothetical protein [Gammaproteobacteria bacterium]